jgi:acylphosphatase
MLCYHIHITGSVYKTGYRYFLKENAARLKITGCVFYFPDRSAGIISLGEEKNLKEFISLCISGNLDSVVTNVEIRTIPSVQFDSFEVIDENETENQSMTEIIYSLNNNNYED